MSSLSYDVIQQHYREAMQYSGPEATGRLWIADRLAEAARESLIAEAASGAPRVRPVILSLGGLLVRVGTRLEAVGAVECRREYA
jgi:hypothetical protein